jgi:hypothetical protein
MPATEKAVEKKQEKSKSNEAEGGAARRCKSSRVKSGPRGNKRLKEETAQRRIIANCVELIDKSLKRMALDRKEIQRLKEETRAVLSRL